MEIASTRPIPCIAQDFFHHERVESASVRPLEPNAEIYRQHNSKHELCMFLYIILYEFLGISGEIFAVHHLSVTQKCNGVPMARQRVEAWAPHLVVWRDDVMQPRTAEIIRQP